MLNKLQMKKWLKQLSLGDSIGTDNATALIAKIKEEMAENQPKTEADIKNNY